MFMFVKILYSFNTLFQQYDQKRTKRSDRGSKSYSILPRTAMFQTDQTAQSDLIGII